MCIRDRGKADPAAFMEGIEDMARELVKTYPFLSDDKAQLFKPEREALGSCQMCIRDRPHSRRYW